MTSEPELDYAFLAEFARVEGDSLTSVGASYTRVLVREVPTRHTVYVAGRVRAPQHSEPFTIGVGFKRADQSEHTRLQTTVNPESDGFPYSGKIGLTFAIGFEVDLESTALHEVLIFIDDKQVRRLAFDVVAVGKAEVS